MYRSASEPAARNPGLAPIAADIAPRRRLSICFDDSPLTVGAALGGQRLGRAPEHSGC